MIMCSVYTPILQMLYFTFYLFSLILSDHLETIINTGLTHQNLVYGFTVANGIWFLKMESKYRAKEHDLKLEYSPRWILINSYFG